MPNPFKSSPQARRLARDYQEMLALREESTILDFQTVGDPPERYRLRFNGRGLGPEAELVDAHEVSITIGADYPRTPPGIFWETPILHPNIHNGHVCMGSFTMSPYVRLVEVVEILWDMARMAVYNIHSGYHAKLQWPEIIRRVGGFPVDPRILRDRRPPPSAAPEGGEPDIFIMSGARPPGRARDPYDQEALKANIQFWLHRNKLDRDAHVYTQEEWQAKMEPYGSHALLTITTEGPLNDLVNRPTWRGAAYEHQRFVEFLESIGLYYEFGYSWSLHLYPTERAR